MDMCIVENQYASKVYLNGNIITMNSTNSLAEAVAVKGEKILAVGRKEEIQPLIGPDTLLIDLEGKTVTPGFYDSHSHFSHSARFLSTMVNLNAPPIGKMNSIEDCIAALKTKAESTPAGQYVLGWGYDDSSIGDKRHLTRSDLDRVSTEHPVLVLHISVHLGYANSMTLDIEGIKENTPSPDGGMICKDPVTGIPNGVLEERAITNIFFNLTPPTPQERVTALAKGSKNYVKMGVTTANDGGIDYPYIVDYEEAVSEGLMGNRVVLNTMCNNHDNLPELLQNVEELGNKNPMITIGGMKILHDGSPQGCTAYFSRPYHTPYKGDPTYRGYPLMPREALVNLVKEIHKAGFQCLIHGNGDAAIDDILYAFREAQNEFPRPDARHVIIHAQTAREDQLDLMKELGVIPSFFVLHTYYWGDRHRDIFMGPERASRISPLKSAMDRGIRFTTHCDSPVVSQDPLMSIWAAVNRVTSSGKVLGPEQRISPIEALRTYTINAAYQNFEENIKGSIEPGKLADLVILEGNPLTCDPMHIKLYLIDI